MAAGPAGSGLLSGPGRRAAAVVRAPSRCGVGKRALPGPQAGGRAEGRTEAGWDRLGHAEVKWLP